MIKLIRTKDGNIVGDIDVFFSNDDDGLALAELNIMIASSEWRRRGYASEALTLTMQYCMQRLDVRRFVAKIGKDNQASRLFFERHGFRTSAKTPDAFAEFRYELDAGNVPSSDLRIDSAFQIDIA